LGTRDIAIVLLIAALCCGSSFSESLIVQDEEFLEKIERDSFRYFEKEINPENGLIKDSSRPGSPCSVAAVGFGLTALCIGESRGWIEKGEAYFRILRVLRTFKDKVPHEKGFFYHFINMRTGERAWNSEISSIDTALFLAGALFAGEYFKGTPIESLARELYERVEWPWMLNGKKVFCMGWKPETGFLPYYWDSYSEAMILYALAIGSPTYPIKKDSWLAWARKTDNYKGYEVIYSFFGSIFTYQYSHAWIDFRNLYDNDVNYFENSINACMANRQFCADNSEKYVTYGQNRWGLTACIGPEGYKGYGAKPGVAYNDGTVAPYGMAGSIVFAEEESIMGLKHLYENYKNQIYGKYGFKDAFNTDRGWWAEEYLAIDVGITLIMIENYRTELIWNKFNQISAIDKWIKQCFDENIL